MPTVYLITGCNGAGKTTASLTLLPEMLDCKEFVNADNIAAGISPFQPDKVAIEAGRLMLKRINDLIKVKVDFAIETTLSSRNYISKIKEFKKEGYEVILIYFWLNTPLLAIERIKQRVKRGGHFIPDDIVIRRYMRGIKNLLQYFIPLCDYWLIFDNSNENAIMVAEGIKDLEKEIFNNEIWQEINKTYNEK
ncbi:MAG: zeta toxin [Stygiobacter sp.]|nr:MAG: zeta toxin [Stygiobacter sp.]